MADEEWTVTMPKLGETVTEGELTKWLKGAGDEIAFDDPLFEVSTDKVDSEIPVAVRRRDCRNPGGRRRDRSGRDATRPDHGDRGAGGESAAVRNPLAGGSRRTRSR